MTKISNDLSILACPECNHYYQVVKLVSYNTFGDSTYLDGYQSNIINNLIPALVECKKCNSVIKRSSLIQIAPNSVVNKNSSFDSLKEPSISGYFEQLNHPFVNELTTRLEVMWRYNHQFRVGSPVNDNIQTHRLKFQSQAKANELRLIELLDNNDNERLIRADILRRNKSFNEAKRIINNITDKSLSHICDLLYSLCCRKNIMIVTTDFDPDPQINRCRKNTLMSGGNLYESIGVVNGKKYLTLATSSKYSQQRVLLQISVILALPLILKFVIF